MTAPALLPGPAELGVFAAAVFVLNATPGVDFLLTVSRTLTGGARAGIAAAAGISVGCVGHVLAAAFGLAALLAWHPQAFDAIRWAGAAYLVWLAWGMWRSAWLGGDGADAGAAGAGAAPRSAWADFRAGVLTNVLNPKVALFFLAFLPQFVPADAAHKTASFLLLGALAIAQGTVFLLALVALVARLGRLGRLGASARLRRAANAIGGGLFVALALRLAEPDARA